MMPSCTAGQKGKPWRKGWQKQYLNPVRRGRFRRGIPCPITGDYVSFSTLWLHPFSRLLRFLGEPTFSPLHQLLFKACEASGLIRGKRRSPAFPENIFEHVARAKKVRAAFEEADCGFHRFRIT